MVNVRDDEDVFLGGVMMVGGWRMDGNAGLT